MGRRVRPVPREGLQKIRFHMVATDQGWPPVSIVLNSNENALGPSPAAINAATSAIGTVHRYVEGQAGILAPALATRHGLDPATIAIGCGSDDLLSRLARCYLEPGSELLRSANSYLKVPNYALANDAVPVDVPDHDLTPSVECLLSRVTSRTSIVYIANPDNPSGSLLSVESISALHRGLPANVLLVIDCAYAEYVDAPQSECLAEMVEAHDNVVVTRTFSKVYGLAGARVGWMHAPEHVVESLSRISLTFPLSTMSLEAALAALCDQEHVHRVVSQNREMREKYTGIFSKYCERVYPGQANFLLLRFDDMHHSAQGAASFLRSRGIAVRRFAAPSYDRCIRITLGFDDDLRAVADALDQYVNG